MYLSRKLILLEKCNAVQLSFCGIGTLNNAMGYRGLLGNGLGLGLIVR